ncbi:MAG: DUF4258 domain-containing protein [Desulfuromonadales bacterium]
MAHYNDSKCGVTNHAHTRMITRSITEWQIDQVMRYGRSTYTRKAVIYAVGRKEIKVNGRFLEQCEGIHVLCSADDGAIITTYRNHNLKSLRH